MDRRVVIMAVIRALFGLISLTGSIMMFLLNDLTQAIRINGIIGSMGPFVLLLVSAIGIAGVAAQMDIRKVILILAGVIFIILGTR